MPGTLLAALPLGGRTATSGISARSGQLLQERLGCLQVGGVKALGKSVVDLCQQLASFGALALLLPEPSEAHRGPQL
jgi:hypothetical protein